MLTIAIDFMPCGFCDLAVNNGYIAGRMSAVVLNDLWRTEDILSHTKNVTK
jgi:hypothetical protein